MSVMDWSSHSTTKRVIVMVEGDLFPVSIQAPAEVFASDPEYLRKKALEAVEFIGHDTAQAMMLDAACVNNFDAMWDILVAGKPFAISIGMG